MTPSHETRPEGTAEPASDLGPPGSHGPHGHDGSAPSGGPAPPGSGPASPTPEPVGRTGATGSCESPDPTEPADLADLARLDDLSGAADLADLLDTAPAPGLVVRLRGGDDLVAALPVLLGFHPAESVVLVGFGGRSTQRVGLTVRVDLPPPDDVEAVCEQAVGVLVTDRPVGAAVVIVTDGRSDRPPSRPDVAAVAQRVLVEAGVEPLAVLWAGGTAAGRPWACYDLPGQRCGCRGVVPTPASAAVAAATARRGRPVLPTREAVGAILEPEDGRVLRRRARLRTAERRRTRQSSAGSAGGSEPDDVAGHRDALHRAVRDAAAGRLVVDDVAVLRLCAALDDPSTREEAVRLCLGPDAPAAEQLWAALSRAVPGPDRAEPAALFAACALLRGDGTLAGIAVQRALDAVPGHRLAGMVDDALQTLAGPPALRRRLEQVYGPPC